jgi:Cdc6-like AAA superfamily ATPase
MQQALPWLPIPRFPQVGQPFAFADRVDQLAVVYRAIVDAGNTLVRGERPMPVRLAVSGYKGVGKSSLVLKALELLRDPESPTRMTSPYLSTLPDPEELQKWLVLRVSGKHVRGIDGLPDDLHRSVLDVLQDTVRGAEQATPGVLKLPFYHRLFPTRERELYDKVRTALTALTLTVEFVRAYRGAKLSERIEETRKVERSVEIKAFLETQLQAKGIHPTSGEGRAAMGLSSSFLGKWAQSFDGKRVLEQDITVNADLATEALNGFFGTTTAAGIPTVLVLDDFDELASSAGPSHAQRAKVLMDVLGVFNQLAPTCLVIALRQEYEHEDLLRQFRRIYVPPMTREAACEMLDAWTGVQVIQWSDEMRAALRAVGHRFIQAFPENAPVVVPDGFLPLVTFAARDVRPGESTKDLFLRYLRLHYDGETVRAVVRLSAALSDDDLESCAETIPIDPVPYSLRPSERRALEKSGLLRPAMAWNDEDTRVIIDPLVAYLRRAS